jgi:hypothetical protein
LSAEHDLGSGAKRPEKPLSNPCNEQPIGRRSTSRRASLNMLRSGH